MIVTDYEKFRKEHEERAWLPSSLGERDHARPDFVAGEPKVVDSDGWANATDQLSGKTSPLGLATGCAIVVTENRGVVSGSESCNQRRRRARVFGALLLDLTTGSRDPA